ncbi:hypothetical protein FRC17_010192 [Serendipita sp. 399]|nr:hypothetical protein FRC17_010192 [Serendipita sp. 399]
METSYPNANSFLGYIQRQNAEKGMVFDSWDVITHMERREGGQDGSNRNRRYQRGQMDGYKCLKLAFLLKVFSFLPAGVAASFLLLDPTGIPLSPLPPVHQKSQALGRARIGKKTDEHLTAFTANACGSENLACRFGAIREPGAIRGIPIDGWNHAFDLRLLLHYVRMVFPFDSSPDN